MVFQLEVAMVSWSNQAYKQFSKLTARTTLALLEQTQVRYGTVVLELQAASYRMPTMPVYAALSAIRICPDCRTSSQLRYCAGTSRAGKDEMLRIPQAAKVFCVGVRDYFFRANRSHPHTPKKRSFCEPVGASVKIKRVACLCCEPTYQLAFTRLSCRTGRRWGKLGFQHELLQLEIGLASVTTVIIIEGKYHGKYAKKAIFRDGRIHEYTTVPVVPPAPDWASASGTFTSMPVPADSGSSFKFRF